MKLSQFKGSSLTRSEMKSVTGGTIYCQCNYEGTGIDIGPCSGSSPSECEGYGCQPGGTMKACW